MDEQKEKKVALAAGGTGGHLFPALALAEEIISQPGFGRVVFLAAERPLDRHILGGADRLWGRQFKCVYLPGSAYAGQPGWRKLLSILYMAWAVLSAWFHLRGCRAVVAFGGYASVASVLAARLRGIAVYLHEQNAIPGRANRLMARFAKHIFLTFEEAAPLFGPRADRCRVVGCPVRKKILFEREAGPHARMRMLVVGGSQGTKFFLDFFLGRPEFFAWLLERVDILFLAGSQLAETPPARRLVENARHLRGSFTLLPFLDRMGPAVRSADIILSRSGASFLAELASVGKARTILVPFPLAMDGHQDANAKALQRSGHSLAELRVIDETQQAEMEETIHGFVVGGPVPPPPSFSDRHAGAANEILSELHSN
ncbi:MAG: hypothetical protein A3G34_00555 [Candidatus Lindowbacteria bacterium RIFCSPLOWO2_12_FULL_62_27]|nr:MAG: hypothetical protein A3G34_00555 [Candidatus Lindowbacteria bacterium RIFCSPLOWO2_12_FULL_62_27]